MVCMITCAIAYGLIAANIWTMMVDKKYENNLLNQLDDNQKGIYDEIVKERMKLYLQGLVLGLLIAIGLVYKLKLNIYASVCLLVAVVGVIQVAYYELMPKTKWMVDNLNTNEQNKAWMSIYREMKKRWHYGFISICNQLLGYKSSQEKKEYSY